MSRPLPTFATAAEQHEVDVICATEMDPVARPEMDPHFCYAVTDRRAIAEITTFGTANTLDDASFASQVL